MPEAAQLLGEVINTLNSEHFEDRLSKWLNASVRYDNFIIIAYFQDQPPNSLYALIKKSRVLENFEGSYVSSAYLLDPYHALHVNKSPQGLYRLNDIAPDQFRRNRYYREYYQKTTMVDEIAYIAYPAEGVSVHIALGRDITSRQRFTARELAAANAIAPIVCALSERHWSDLNSTGKFDETMLVKSLITKTQEKYQIKLSPRQAQIALMILRGHSSVSIGLQLEISPQTVKVFRKQLYKKCKISSLAELFNLMMPILSS
jgi:DNA-binding CsgD family transcriptional regulator